MSSAEEKSSLLDGGGTSAGADYGSLQSPNPDEHNIMYTIDTSQRRDSSLAAIAAAADITARRESIMEMQNIQRKSTLEGVPPLQPKPLIDIPSMESLDVDEVVQQRIDAYNSSRRISTTEENEETLSIHHIIGQLPAIAIASVLNFMVGIPFGASYFPTELPLIGKEVLGLRMFLFSTMVAQFVFTFKSKFHNGIGLQMVENVPFCLELARIVLDEVGDSGGDEASSTLFFLFAISSVIVGIVFYILGKLELGRVVYFFPSHVLVGCIGGIGAFIVVTSLEVTTNATFSFTASGFNECIVQNLNLLWPVIAFEVGLRLLMRFTSKNSEQQYALLGPIYYCFVTPAFYAGLRIVGMSIGAADDAGYFFPPLSTSDSVFNEELFDIFTEIHFASISWKAVIRAIPTMFSLAAFSLIHVPINIPAFGVSSNVEPDMNVELIAHGYSNTIAGLFGGLQNYMCYSNSVLYYKANGDGRFSSLAIVVITIILFIYGPSIAAYVPRCMAGTLLLHVGIDLVLEGVIESYEDYDKLEYSGVVLIAVVMVIFGMDAGLIAGVIAALSTFVAQSIYHQDPIKGIVSGARLRSSAWSRSEAAEEILDNNNKGRQRILVVSLQGHIFFGNSVKMIDDIKRILSEKRKANDEPAVVILDLTNVLGLDSSAAQSIAKLKSFILKNFSAEILLFVTGSSDGFKCSYNLSKRVADTRHSISVVESSPQHEHRLSLAAGALQSYVEHESKSKLIAEIPHSRVCETLDDALIFGEDILIALADPSILKTDSNERFPFIRRSSKNIDEVRAALETLFPQADENDIDILYNLLCSETYRAGDTIWNQGDESTSLKIVIYGTLISLLEDEMGASETICPGSTIGELGLVNGIRRLTTVKVLSDKATLYTLSMENWNVLTQEHPKVARCIDMLVIRYLSHRVQHVSNSNIFSQTRSLPV